MNDTKRHPPLNWPRPFLPLLALTLLAVGCQNDAKWAPGATLTLRIDPGASQISTSMRGVHAVNKNTAWISGSGSAWHRTADASASWDQGVVDGTGQIDFRDIHAFDSRTALLMAAGQPARLYRTTDAGESWSTVHDDSREGVFFDSMAFWDNRRGIAFSDPVDGAFVVISTDDGGRSWRAIDASVLPSPMENEAGFAASGTCVATRPGGLAWIGLGGDTGLPGARVLRTTDYGKTWSAHLTRLPPSASSGVFSVLFTDDDRGIVVGGDYTLPDGNSGNIAITIDGGRTWMSITGPPPSGYRSAVAHATLARRDVLVAVGPNGIDASTNAGDSWVRLSDTGFHAISFAPGSSVGFACGSDSRIARITLGLDDNED